MKTKVNTKKKVSTKPKTKALKQGAVIKSFCDHDWYIAGFKIYNCSKCPAFKVVS